jgi:hypothetical protein
MARYMLRLKTQGKPDRTADFDAGEHVYVKGDIVALAENGLWRVEKLGPEPESHPAARAVHERRPTVRGIEGARPVAVPLRVLADAAQRSGLSGAEARISFGRSRESSLLHRSVRSTEYPPTYRRTTPM